MPLQIVNIENSNVEFVDKKSDRVEALQQENAALVLELLETKGRLEESEFQQANLILNLIEKGVL